MIPKMETELGTMILQELQNTQVSWKYHNTRIRDKEGRCPVCSVLHQKNTSINEKLLPWQAAEQFLGRPLTPDESLDISTIATAADRIYSWDIIHSVIRSYLEYVLILHPKPVKKRSWWKNFNNTIFDRLSKKKNR